MSKNELIIRTPLLPAKNTERIAQKRAENQARLRQEQNPVARYFMD